MMAELSREETSKLWEDIQFHWDVIKKKKDGDPDKSRKEINRIQGLLGIEVTDFIKETPTQEVKEYTDAQAEEQFTEAEVLRMEKAVERAIAIKHLLSDMIVKHYPKLKGNAPGIGQLVNITYDLIKDSIPKENTQ